MNERFGELFANHFSTIGIVGGNEMCLNLLGVPITDKTGKGFALSVLHFLRERCVEAQDHTGHLFNLEAVPAEGCSYRLARLDKSLYPDITVANEEAWRGAAPYYELHHPRAGCDPFASSIRGTAEPLTPGTGALRCGEAFLIPRPARVCPPGVAPDCLCHQRRTSICPPRLHPW